MSVERLSEGRISKLMKRLSVEMIRVSKDDA